MLLWVRGGLATEPMVGQAGEGTVPCPSGLSHLLTLSVLSELRSTLTCIAGISVCLVLLLSHLHLTILFLSLLSLA